MKTSSHYISDKTLLYFRICSAVVICGYVIWRFSRSGLLYFYYLTYWNWTVNFLYFPTAIAQSIHPDKKYLANLKHCLFSIMQPISLLVFLLYWILLSGVLFDADTDLEERISGVASHSFNIILPVIEMFFSLNMLKSKDLVFPFTMISCYTLVALSIHSLCSKDWPYKFMKIFNDENGGTKWEVVIGLWFGIIILAGLLFLFAMFLIYLRDRVAAKKRRLHLPDISSGEMIIPESILI